MPTATDILKQILASTPKASAQIIPVPVKDREIKIGNFYNIAGHASILAQTDAGICKLIALDGGNRWNEGTRVVNVLKITEEEFEQITGRRHEVEELGIGI